MRVFGRARHVFVWSVNVHAWFLNPVEVTCVSRH